MQLLRRLLYRIASRVTDLESGVLRSYLAADVIYTEDTSLEDTPLSVVAAAGRSYAVKLVVISGGASAALKMDFGGTAGIADFRGTWLGFPDTVANGIKTYVESAGTDFGPTTNFDENSCTYQFDGSVEITTGGTFLLRAAQTASSEESTAIKQGSVLTLTKMN